MNADYKDGVISITVSFMGEKVFTRRFTIINNEILQYHGEKID